MMMGNAVDPTIAIHHAIAMLPRAVAAGQVTPGAAALLMQAVHQQMGIALSMGEQSQSHSHPQPQAQPSSQPLAATDSQSYPVEALPPSAHHEQPSQAHAGVHAAVAPPPLGPTAGNSYPKKSAPTNDAMDGLLLLAACSDVQRQDELKKAPRQTMMPSPGPHYAAQGSNTLEGSTAWQSRAACVPSVV